MNQKQENPLIADGLIGQAYCSIKIANEIPGTLDRAAIANKEEFKKILQDQIKIIQSELKETIDAIEQEDEIETLDGGCDLFVTAAGLLQIIETKVQARLGLLDVCANNLTKFISVFHPDKDKIIEDTIQKYKEKDITVKPVINQKYQAIAFIDENNKYKKPSIYKDVDLQQYFCGTKN